jgi:hypothetical protein
LFCLDEHAFHALTTLARFAWFGAAISHISEIEPETEIRQPNYSGGSRTVVIILPQKNTPLAKYKNLIVFCHFSKKTTIFAKTKTANKWHT